MVSKVLSPGDIAIVVNEREAWSVSSSRYEDWLNFDTKKIGEIVCIVSINENLKGDRVACVAGPSGIFLVNEKFLKKQEL